jgi:hypothetical protein
MKIFYSLILALNVSTITSRALDTNLAVNQFYIDNSVTGTGNMIKDI